MILEKKIPSSVKLIDSMFTSKTYSNLTVTVSCIQLTGIQTKNYNYLIKFQYFHDPF